LKVITFDYAKPIHTRRLTTFHTTVVHAITWFSQNWRRGRWGTVDEFCMFNHCYFNSSPNTLKICHTI